MRTYLNVPEEYLCTMCGDQLRMFDEGTSLNDMCAGCFGSWTRQRAVERLHEEAKDLVWRLADTDQRAADLTRLLQLVLDWPELADELRKRLAVAVGA